MSLINKMLKDLDARGSTGAEVMPADIKPVLREERRTPAPLVLGLVAGAVALAAAGFAGWRYYQQQPRAAAFVPRPAVAAAPRVVTPVVDLAARAREEALAAEAARQQALAAEEEARAQAEAEEKKELAAQARPAERDAAERKAAARTERRDEKRIAAAVKARAAIEEKRAAAKPVAPKAAPATAAVQEPKASGARARGEDVYRRALATLQDGRLSEAIALFEQTLRLEPRHEAARQTLVGLLVEAGRADEAMRQLQQALVVEPRQPAMAMLLARLQIERGGSGVETLTRTLPYAGSNSEYRAFLAGALQRAGRHAEAAEQYQAALRGAPQNGVWWMGLGISLQAEKRNADALAAYQRAKAAGTLSADLQAFVERKLQQLSR